MSRLPTSARALTASEQYTLVLSGAFADSGDTETFRLTSIRTAPQLQPTDNDLSQPVGGTISASLEQDSTNSPQHVTLVAFDALLGSSNFRWSLEDTGARCLNRVFRVRRRRRLRW
jgi:hypothetical protein